MTSAPFVAIFDADHVPYKNFLKKLVGYFVDPSVGFVQTPNHLDPKWSNIYPVMGVGLAVVLTAWASRRGRREARNRQPGVSHD